jgi:hypothetical protein
MEILNHKKCQTENCDNEAIGLINGKFRCGNCMINFNKKMQEAKEKFFLTE